MSAPLTSFMPPLRSARAPTSIVVSIHKRSTIMSRKF